MSNRRESAPVLVTRGREIASQNHNDSHNACESLLRGRIRGLASVPDPTKLHGLVV